MVAPAQALHLIVSTTGRRNNETAFGKMTKSLTRRAGLLVLCLASCVLPAIGALHEESDTGLYEILIAGDTFFLEVAADEVTRMTGLSGRDFIAADGGMIFVFPRSRYRWFYMRDCLIPIDILFLDSAGVITATYTMLPERPRMVGESERAYTSRLKRYHSNAPSQYVIELRAGTIEHLGLAQGDRVMLDSRWLKRALDQ